MQIFVNQADINPVKFEEYDYIPLLDAQNGCLAGCRTGLLMYTQTEYKQGGTHEDQEGFYVLEGTGRALVGESDFPIYPGTCFIVPPGSYHSIKRNAECDFIKLFFFHAAV